MEHDCSNELYHYGVKGMRWGVRRYQNPDGSLTAAGKKRVSKKYKKVSMEVSKKLSSNANRWHMEAYNEAADYMNRGGIDKFNAGQRKKYGEKYYERNGYQEDYLKSFDKVIAKNLNRRLNDFYSNDASAKKARNMVKQYDMTKWDDLAKTNEANIEEVRRMVEKHGG